MSNEPRRGEVWRVQFNPTRGDEIQKTRPAIVVSADGLTRLQLRLVIPLTGWKPGFTNLTWLVQIDPSSDNGLQKVSAANPLQTRSVSLERFVERLGVLDEVLLDEVVLALGIVVRYPLRSQA
ncbi:MAG: type II toxin-antitoxin system PemK/MazF family toxin [Phormidium tanganyikae FI6-MK23]|nr:type II toxin-antitoxin system PemK/MazF family toxin [Phormidium tanganyikae FI6-MK23]